MTSKHKSGAPRAKDLDQMSNDELRKELADRKLARLGDDCKIKCENSPGNPVNTGSARENRKTIAHIMTILVRRKEPCIIR